VANACYNQLMAEGYQVTTAHDGETGLKTMHSFKPDAIILDLMLPTMSGPEFIKQVRAGAESARIPIIVFSNTYLTDLIQNSWKAGANKFISKSSCSPDELIQTVFQAIRESNPVAPAPPPVEVVPDKAPPPSSDTDLIFRSGLRKNFIENQPATLAALRASLQSLIKTDSEENRLREIFDLYRRVHGVAGNAGLAGLATIAHMASALEALLKELHEKPKNINSSALRTVAAGVDFLGFLFQHGPPPGGRELSAAKILVVDDEEISRRAIIYSLEKAQLQSVNVESAGNAYKLLAEGPFDLVFLDVDMPGMTGFELCTKLRALPAHKKTPVVFVTALNDFDNRASSTMAGGNDFIAKPFLFIELTVKALIHVLRGKLQPVK
jgi:DNA-binding response OmpR family regulator